MALHRTANKQGPDGQQPSAYQGNECGRSIGTGDVQGEAEKVGSHSTSGNAPGHCVTGDGTQVSQPKEAGPGYVGSYSHHSLGKSESHYYKDLASWVGENNYSGSQQHGSY